MTIEVCLITQSCTYVYFRSEQVLLFYNSMINMYKERALVTYCYARYSLVQRHIFSDELPILELDGLVVLSLQIDLLHFVYNLQRAAKILV